MKEVLSEHVLKAINVNMAVSFRSIYGNGTCLLGLYMEMKVALSGRVSKPIDVSLSASFRSVDSFY